MAQNIAILDGHPDPSPERFCGALADAYAQGAMEAGHETRRIDLGALDTPLLTSASAFADPPPEALQSIQADLMWADHVVIIFPLWLGAVPAKLKALLEQVYRGGFGFEVHERGWTSKLKGRSARLVVTMGMPTPIFWFVFGAHGLKALEKGVLWLSGVGPIRKSVVGAVEAIGSRGRARWLARMRRLGALGR